MSDQIEIVMRQIWIAALCIAIMVPFTASAQRARKSGSLSLEGVVVYTTGGPRWMGIVVESGGRKYMVTTRNNPDNHSRDPIVVGGDVETIGTRVRVTYTRNATEPWGDMLALNATRIVNLGNELAGVGGTSWQSFWSGLRAAVNRRDRAALREMMPSDFVYNCCDSFDSNANGETRDEAFRDWDDPKVRGWIALSRVLSQGSVPASGWLRQS